MKAIQTEYGGYLFRSRLEARWAVVFNALRIEFEYEKEGYDLPSGKYLPDFWLPKMKQWIEIKGQAPTQLESDLAFELADETNSNVLILWGNIPTGLFEGADSGYMHMPVLNPDPESPRNWQGWDNCYRLCECLTCGALGFEFDGRSDRLPCKEKCPKSGTGDKGYTGDSSRIVDAYERGRKARFEHGETPK